MKSTASEFVVIPLSNLQVHPNNIRKTAPSGIAELARSIEKDGLIQNITVTAHPTKADLYLVPSGGRRLLALKQLAKDKKIPADFAVPARLVDATEAEAISLAENQLREPMHPIDQVQAFKEMVEGNQSIAEVASRFGVTETFVKQRLKLAAVSPALLDSYRAGDMTLEQLQAFTVCDDHAKQESVWDDISGQSWNNDADDIRAHLLDTGVNTNDRRLKFIGLANYKKAGGNVIVDLFSDDNSETISDPELLDKLVIEKLQKRATKLQKEEALPWCDVFINQQNSFGNYTAAPSTQREMTETEAAQHADLEAKIEALQKQIDANHDADDFDGDLDAKLCDEIDALEAQRDAIEEACKAPHPDAQEYIGATITLDYSGKIDIHRNIMRTSDAKKLKPITKKDGNKTTGTQNSEPETRTYGEKLMRRMSANKTAILRNEMLKTKCGINALLLQLLTEDYGTELGIYSKTLAMGYKNATNLTSCDSNIETSKAMQEYRQREAELLQPLIEAVENQSDKQQALYDFLVCADSDYNKQLLSLCAANRIDIVTNDETTTGTSHILISDFLSDLGVAEYWHANRENYLNHVSRTQIIEAVQDAVTIDAAEPMLPMKKAEAAEYAEDILVISNWLPTPMRVNA